MMLIAQIFIAFFILFVVSSIVIRGKKRVEKAVAALELKSIPASVKTQFGVVASRSYMKAWRRYWAVVILGSIAAYIGFQVYATSQASSADLSQWFLFTLVTYSIVLLTLIISTSFLVGTAFQHEALRRFLAQQKGQANLKKARVILTPRYGELGVSVFSIAAVIGSLASGAGIIAVLFMASQTAIECARSSKCI